MMMKRHARNRDPSIVQSPVLSRCKATAAAPVTVRLDSPYACPCSRFRSCTTCSSDLPLLVTFGGLVTETECVTLGRISSVNFYPAWGGGGEVSLLLVLCIA